MASGTYWSGRSAFVIKNGVSYPFKNWSMSIERTRIDITNFKSANAWREFLSGFRSGTLTLEGPLDTDLSLIDDDDAVTIVVGVGGANQITFECVILKNGMKQDVDDAARYTVEAAVTGAPVFTWGE